MSPSRDRTSSWKRNPQDAIKQKEITHDSEKKRAKKYLREEILYKLDLSFTLLCRHLLVSGGGGKAQGEKDLCPVQPRLPLLDFRAVRRKLLCHLTGKGSRNTTSF